MVNFSTVLAVLGVTGTATDGACATFVSNYGADVHLLHNFRVYYYVCLLFRT